VKDAELMQRIDGELDEVSLDNDTRSKADALGELGELVRGHVELAADALPQGRFDAMWREIDKAIDREGEAETAPEAARSERRPAGIWRRIGRWFDHYRGHLITGAVSAGAVAALAIVLRGGGDGATAQNGSGGRGPIETMPAAYRPTEIEDLDTPGGTGTVFDLKDEDGSTTVIWVTPSDTVEGI
jgi:hypothetical protein